MVLNFHSNHRTYVVDIMGTFTLCFQVWIHALPKKTGVQFTIYFYSSNSLQTNKHIQLSRKEAYNQHTPMVLALNKIIGRKRCNLLG